ncbi:GTPase IMAP family member 4 [Patella vulgata]|uniref:GTPase IMAP family member 4 n=1 Tax=Patella vulgata TaxID=6465 RepID=UPI0024A927D4|nr:GTPase IMAP family member 4 [Patella vulgata]
MAGVSSVPEIRLTLIGKVGAGKSCLGNSLLKKNEFISRQDSQSVTSESSLGQRRLMLNGIETELKIVDTPGLFSIGKKNSSTVKEIVKCIELLSPGPHAFIFVIKIGRLTHEDQKVLKYFKDTFGELVDRFGVVVFTGSDLLNDISFKDWIQGATNTFKSFLKRCKNRYTIINNLDNLERKSRDLDNILNLVQKTIKDNHGEFYQNEMFEEAKNLFEVKLKDERENVKLQIQQLTAEREKERDEWKRKEQELLARIQKNSVEYHESSPDAKRRKVIPRREKGVMLPEDNFKIISNYVYLTENLDPLHPLLDSLYEKQVLNEDDLEKIDRAKSEGTNAMIRQFLDILRNCGINAYSKFIHCLNKSGYGAVAEQLASDIDMDGRNGLVQICNITLFCYL